MNKVLSPTGVTISMNLRELVRVYAESTEDFICMSIAGLADTLQENRIDYTYLSNQVGKQWWGKVLCKSNPDQARHYSFFEGWNYGTEYSFDEFKEYMIGKGDYDKNSLYDREYRQWVFGKVVDKFGDVKFVFKIREHDC
jgi:hypothetical protein